MKKLVITMASPSFQEVAKLTLPSIREYAVKIGADFLSLTGCHVSKHLGWERFRLQQYFGI